MTLHSRSNSTDIAQHVYASKRDRLPDLEPPETFHDEIEGGLRIVTYVCFAATVVIIGSELLAFGRLW
jgi:hypothetical protein